LFHDSAAGRWAANTTAGLVLILLAFEPTRDLRPVLALLGIAAACWLAAAFWARRK
jgi:hypothetical protein